MKIVHVLKRIEMIDNDIRELKKLEKTITRNKSFSTPIYMTIEKQINIMLGDRIKLLELKIDNPPLYLVEEIEGVAPDKPEIKEKPKEDKKIKKQPVLKNKKAGPADDDDEIQMLTQDQIDAKFGSMKAAADKVRSEEKKHEKKNVSAGGNKNGDSIKLLDIALQKGTLASDQEKDRKVKFFRDNFPLD
jgi:hypothetical protein